MNHLQSLSLRSMCLNINALHSDHSHPDPRDRSTPQRHHVCALLTPAHKYKTFLWTIHTQTEDPLDPKDRFVHVNSGTRGKKVGGAIARTLVLKF